MQVTLRTIDFAPKTITYYLRHTSYVGFFILSFTFFSVYVAIDYVTTAQSSMIAVEGNIKTLKNAVNAQASVSEDMDITPDMSNDVDIQLNAAISELNIPWSDFFDAIENASSNVKLISIEPNVQARTLQIQAESETRNEIFQFLVKLNKSEVFKRALLVKYEAPDSLSQKKYRFWIETNWTINSEK